MRRGGRPGLIGLAARTAVITGTANAMGNRAHAQRQAADQQAQFQAAQQQAQIDAAAAAALAAVPPPAAAPQPPAPAAGFDLVGELQKLAALKDAGILDDAEFVAAKAKLLG